ncbi:hypothetical protein, partial [Photorhabdus heterorhabditis]|uniref:hypothetical protein n=1 Tax=Photorhabdus heterorhabditis TaxID=880156 RepID=UPI001CB74362
RQRSKHSEPTFRVSQHLSVLESPTGFSPYIPARTGQGFTAFFAKLPAIRADFSLTPLERAQRNPVLSFLIILPQKLVMIINSLPDTGRLSADM